jgi:tripartite-type tricarboxylate transporter receptor subunit TctC
VQRRTLRLLSSTHLRQFFRPLFHALVSASLMLSASVWAQGAPLHVLVGFPPGGGSDAIARTLGDKLKDVLGNPVLVENRAGAGGQIAAQALKAAAPDGNTVFLTHDHAISILPQVLKNPGYDPARDFVAVAGIATFVNAFALSAGTPAKTLPAYLAWVKNQGRGKGNVGVPAPASVPEFLVQVMAKKYALDLQAAPYRGGAPMMADMLGNQIGAGVGSVPDFIENHRAGRLQVVAVMGTKRQAILPDVPTFAELGLAGFEEVAYYGVFAPVGTPRIALDRLADALAKVLAMPDVKERLTRMGLTVGFVPGPQFASREQAYTRVWSRIIQSSGFVAQ